MFLDDMNSLSGDKPILLFAHGAGAGGESDFIVSLKDALLAEGIEMVRFNFGFMQAMLSEQKRRPPSKLTALIDEFDTAFQALIKRINAPIFIGGKSMGGRVASHVSLRAHVSAALNGIIVFGFPFHAPRKSPNERIVHLSTIRTPMCIIQGTRDVFGSQSDVATYSLNPATCVEWLDTADHDFKPLKRSTKTQQCCIIQSAKIAKQFLTQSCSHTFNRTLTASAL